MKGEFSVILAYLHCRSQIYMDFTEVNNCKTYSIFYCNHFRALAQTARYHSILLQVYSFSKSNDDAFEVCISRLTTLTCEWEPS